jgi:hypothetical protein
VLSLLFILVLCTSQEKAKTPELTNVQSVADSSEESDVPLVEISAKAKTFGNQSKKRKKILIDSDVSHALPILVLRS